MDQNSLNLITFFKLLICCDAWGDNSNGISHLILEGAKGATDVKDFKGIKSVKGVICFKSVRGVKDIRFVKDFRYFIDIKNAKSI